MNISRSRLLKPSSGHIPACTHTWEQLVFPEPEHISICEDSELGLGLLLSWQLPKSRCEVSQVYRAKAKVVLPLTSCNSLNAPRLPSLGKSLVFCCCCCLCACAKSLCKFISSFRPGSCIIVQQAAQLARLANNLIMPISHTRLLNHYHHHQQQGQLENIIWCLMSCLG